MYCNMFLNNYIIVVLLHRHHIPCQKGRNAKIYSTSSMDSRALMPYALRDLYSVSSTLYFQRFAEDSLPVILSQYNIYYIYNSFIPLFLDVTKHLSSFFFILSVTLFITSLRSSYEEIYNKFVSFCSYPTISLTIGKNKFLLLSVINDVQIC